MKKANLRQGSVICACACNDTVPTVQQHSADLNRQVPCAQQSNKLGDNAMLDDCCNAVIWAISNIREGPAGITDNLQERSEELGSEQWIQESKP